MKLRIGILGTRGIPNYYGGYEQAVSFLAPGLAKRGHEVTVYNTHNHPYHGKNWNGVEIVRRRDPERTLGTAGQFVYDLNCIWHARRRNYDVLLMMGYTSSSLWGRFYPKKTVIITNMDGLEWKRSKYSVPVQKYLRYAEKLAIRYSDYLIADSPGIQNYLNDKYKIPSQYIPYGANIFDNDNIEQLKEYRVNPHEYFMMMARMEPENNIEVVLKGFQESNSRKKFIVVGNYSNKYGKSLRQKFNHDKQIVFTGALFDQQLLHSLRTYCSLYFHGHSVGGTNPSLLEAMASRALIAAHRNDFNHSILGNDAFYFSSASEVKSIIDESKEDKQGLMIGNNLEKVRNSYNWQRITEAYESFMFRCFDEKHRRITVTI